MTDQLIADYWTAYLRSQDCNQRGLTPGDVEIMMNLHALVTAPWPCQDREPAPQRVICKHPKDFPGGCPNIKPHIGLRPLERCPQYEPVPYDG